MYVTGDSPFYNTFKGVDGRLVANKEKGFFQEISFDFCYNEKISKKVGWIWLD